MTEVSVSFRCETGNITSWKQQRCESHDGLKNRLAAAKGTGLTVGLIQKLASPTGTVEGCNAAAG